MVYNIFNNNREQNIEIMDFKLAPATPEIQEAQFIFEKLPWQEFLHLPVVDIGSHYGGFSENFLNAGFKVESFEPNPDNYQKQSLNLQKFLTRNLLHIHQIAASNNDGQAQMYLASADTLHSLCPEWKTIAFPEYFNSDSQITVQCRKLGKFLKEQGHNSLFFAKVDTEGHEFEAISGLIDDGDNSIFPYALMFEVNKRFKDKIGPTLQLLTTRGYKKFIWWIKYNERVFYNDVHADATIPNLDDIEEYYYGNIIALFSPLSDLISLSSENQEVPKPPKVMPNMPFETLWEEMQQKYQALYSNLSEYYCAAFESKYVHTSWIHARDHIRSLLLGSPAPKILDDPIINGKMVRHGFSVSQEYEVTFLKYCISGKIRKLIDGFRDTDFGQLPKECQEFNCSTNTLGHLYYAAKTMENMNGSPNLILEFGGGYGNLARIFKILNPEVTVVIIDLPELLALQYLFLKSTMPEVETLIHFASPQKIKQNAIHLIPAFFIEQIDVKADLFISTFALSETTRETQGMIIKKRFFNSFMSYIAGQLEGASVEDNWYNHQLIFDAIGELYQIVNCQPFHVFQNGVKLYEILGSNQIHKEPSN